MPEWQHVGEVFLQAQIGRLYYERTPICKGQMGITRQPIFQIEHGYMIDPSAAEFRRRRQPETSGAAASRILVGAPARQPKFMGAAAGAVFYSARRDASEVNAIRHSYVIAFLVVKPVTVWATNLKWHWCCPEMV